MTATRNTRRRSTRRTAATPAAASQRITRGGLSQRGVGVVAVAVAALVLLAGFGHATVAALAAVALSMRVKGRRGPVAGSGTHARRLLRGIGWAAVALALLAAAQGSTAPGGPLLGVALAAALATALHLTATRKHNATPRRRK